MKKIAMIIVNYKTYEFTIKCVESIIKNCKLAKDIYVVDNCSCNGSFEILSEKFANYDNVYVVEADANKGYSAGLNYGYKQATLNGTYEYYLFLNNDLLICDEVIEELLATFNCNKAIAVAGGQIVDQMGNRQNSYKYLLTFKKHLLETKPFTNFVAAEETKDGYNYEEILVFDGMVAGCCFVIPSEIMEEIKQLDENIFIYYEEDALGHIIKQLDMRCALNPNAKIVHVGSQTISKSAFTYFQRYRSALYVLWTYAKVKKWQLFVIYSIYRMSFLLKICNGVEYKKYFRELRTLYYQLLKGAL